MFRQNWRSAEQWIAEGLPIKSTASQEAVKLYDCALTQYVGWYNDPSQDGGLEGTLTRMLKADPDFILGRSLALGIDLIGTGSSIRTSTNMNNELSHLLTIADRHRSEIGWREFAHVQALDHFAHGRMRQATETWEQILLQYPTDMMALKMAHDTYFYLGEKSQIRDSIARVYPVWMKKNIPLAGYIHGMYAFGLEETQFYSKAEEQAKMGLEKIPQDAWAVHAMAHCYEMATKPLDGLAFMSRTLTNWSVCDYLACHNYWHWALYHLEQDEPEAAAEILDKRILPQASRSGAMLDLVDLCSLLYRLELIHGPNSGWTSNEQWKKAWNLCEPHLKDHILGFNDAHFAMAGLCTDNQNQVEQLLEDLNEIEHTTYVNKWIPIAKDVIQAMTDMNREQYKKTIDRLLSIKYEIVQLGGSDAQRDVFNQLLIVAAIRANDSSLCQSLANERRALKGDDVVVRKLTTKLS